MEDLGKHISELLFDHDCVIVPALGGFLASNQSSRIISSSQVVYPPYRLVAFNVFLKQNDGLLANHLLDAKNIQYAEALQLIESFTSYCLDTLEKGKKVNITDVGTLFFDKEKNIQFEAFRNLTHRKDSFGLEAVNFIPVQRGERIEAPRTIPEKTIRPSIRENKETLRQKIVANKGYIGAVFVGAAMVWFSLNLFLVGPKNYESTSLNPFDSQEIILNKSDSLRNLPAPIRNGESYDPNQGNVVVVPSVETTSVASVEPSETRNTVIESPKPTVTQEPKPNAISPVGNNTVIGSGSYFVVAGVFKISENATKLLNQLQQQGFANAQIIEADGRSYVSFGTGTSHFDAMAMIDSLHRKNTESWIWKH